MIDPFTFGIGMVWGVSTLVAWSIILRDRWRNHVRFRDRRSRHELLFVVPLWGVSAAWCVVLALSVMRDVADVGTAIRGGLFGFGIGLYTFGGVMGAIGTRRRSR